MRNRLKGAGAKSGKIGDIEMFKQEIKEVRPDW